MPNTKKRKKEQENIIDGTKLTLEEWLTQIHNPKVNVLPSIAFPTSEMRDEYLKDINIRRDEEVLNLIRRFLIHTGSTRFDYISLHDYSYSEMQLRILRGESAWEGLTWVIDLIRENPGRAIEVLEAYFDTHIQLLDRSYWWHRLHDAIALIRAKWIHTEHPRETILDLGGRKFEILVAILYKQLGYDVYLTKKSHDGGVDVIAKYEAAGRQHKSLIQCKCVRKKNIDVKDIRELHGVIEDAKISKGIFITTAFSFTPAAIKWAANNPRIELINYSTLIQLLNEYFGIHWMQRIEYYTNEQLHNLSHVD